MKRLNRAGRFASFFLFAAIIAATISSCGGRLPGPEVNAGRAKVKANLRRTIASLRFLLEQLGVRAAKPNFKMPPPNGRGEGYPYNVNGYDPDLGFWFSGTWAPWAHDFNYFADEALTIPAGSEHYSEPQNGFPASYTFELTITYGPNHRHQYWQTTYYDDYSGYNMLETGDFTDVDDTRYQYSWATVNGSTTMTTTTTYPGGLTISSMTPEGEGGTHTINWMDSTGEEGFFEIAPDGSGSGGISQGGLGPSKGRSRGGGDPIADMVWGSDGHGTIHYYDGGPDPDQPYTFEVPHGN